MTWDWHIKEFTDTYRAWAWRQFLSAEQCYMSTCRKKGCGRRVDCYVSYKYVTGRSGRVTFNETPYCREHAQQIVSKKTHNGTPPHLLQ